MVPAICAVGYTAATINNSFEGSDFHSLIGFLDSPVVIIALCILLYTTITSGDAGLMAAICSIPFMTDMLISVYGVCQKLTGSSESTQKCSVEEVNDERLLN